MFTLNYVKDNTNNDPDGISYNKWCKDKLELIKKKDDNTTSLKVGAIYWVDLGYNIGSELRKLRPAILWRSASNKKMWTAIPLTSKHKDDNYYFHYKHQTNTHPKNDHLQRNLLYTCRHLYHSQ